MSNLQGPILVFDSGVGGLSVVAHLRAVMPGRSLTFLCDNAALPYGTKEDTWLIERIVSVCCAGARASGAGVLVVACNTASTLALDALRAALPIPVVGTVPAIKPAAAMSRNGVIGLLATSGTVRRRYTDRLIARFAAEQRVVRVAADALVRQAEQWLAGSPTDPYVIERSLEPLFADAELDTVVLGCTHFPLLRPFFETLAPRPMQWIDSGAAIARRTVTVAPQGRMITEGSDASFATAPAEPGMIHALKRYEFSAPQGIEPLRSEELQSELLNSEQPQ
ncbi:glutamate racemase [Carnimonas nigrificans]|uniref:glutamate racemase n=1 Tax=Carnimonas nigrificans TaxID=64323 RepID=UPI0004AEEA98